MTQARQDAETTLKQALSTQRSSKGKVKYRDVEGRVLLDEGTVTHITLFQNYLFAHSCKLNCESGEGQFVPDSLLYLAQGLPVT